MGDQSATVPVSSTKSIIGHCLGAAGAMETVASILSLSKGFVPPTAHFGERRDGCTLDYVPEVGRRIEGDCTMLKNNFAFGGNNASLVIRVPPDREYAPPETGKNDSIVITGMGIVSPAGLGPGALHEAAASASSPFFAQVNVADGTVRAARVPAFDMASLDRRIDIRNMDRSSVLATAATRLALAGGPTGEKQGQRGDIGLFCNLSAGPSWAESEHISSLLRNNFRINQVAAFPYVVPNSVAGNVCRALRLTGHNTTFSFGPGAGLMGIGFALFAIKSGHAHSIVSLSVDELSERILYDSHAARSTAEDDFVPAEGACALLLETESGARRRGAEVLGTVRSAAYSTDTGNCMEPDSDATVLADTIRSALLEAGITGDDVGVVCCNGENLREAWAVDAVLAGRNVATLDLSAKLGFAEACAPLFTLSYALTNPSLRVPPSKEYILVVFASPSGVNCATVIQKAISKEAGS